MHHNLTFFDYSVLAFVVSIMIGIGVYFSRKVKTSDDYFLAEGKLPGWLVGVSLFATSISGLGFVALPGFTFQNNYLWVSSYFVFAGMSVLAMYFIMPFFRKIKTPSGYEYFERRFGPWARIYLALGYLLANCFRMGIILYAVSLPFETGTGISITWLILFFGIVAVGYAISGGLEAVIWTDLFQSIVLLFGAAACIIAVIGGVPGGFLKIAAEAHDAGKMSLGSLNFSFTERTFWTILILAIVNNGGVFITSQDVIQRYRAPSSEKEARIAIAVGTFLTIPAWILLSFLGTSLWAYYKFFPDTNVQDLALANPEKIVPYFIFTQLPSGLGGLVLAGMLMASISAINGSLNACSATVMGDFYQRFFAPNKTQRHYLGVGRWISAFFGCIMISVAILIHSFRQIPLQDLSFVLTFFCPQGTLGLFLIGFLCSRVDNFSAIFATIVTLISTWIWLFLQSALALQIWPQVKGFVPNEFWLPAVANVGLFLLTYFISKFFRKPYSKDLTDLTILTFRNDSSDSISEKENHKASTLAH